MKQYTTKTALQAFYVLFTSLGIHFAVLSFRFGENYARERESVFILFDALVLNRHRTRSDIESLRGLLWLLVLRGF